MKLRELRQRKGLTIKELSKLSGVSYTLISMIEKGYKDYSRVSIWKLANTLQVDAEEIENE